MFVTRQALTMVLGCGLLALATPASAKPDGMGGGMGGGKDVDALPCNLIFGLDKDAGEFCTTTSPTDATGADPAAIPCMFRRFNDNTPGWILDESKCYTNTSLALPFFDHSDPDAPADVIIISGDNNTLVFTGDFHKPDGSELGWKGGEAGLSNFNPAPVYPQTQGDSRGRITGFNVVVDGSSLEGSSLAGCDLGKLQTAIRLVAGLDIAGNPGLTAHANTIETINGARLCTGIESVGSPGAGTVTENVISSDSYYRAGILVHDHDLTGSEGRASIRDNTIELNTMPQSYCSGPGVGIELEKVERAGVSGNSIAPGESAANTCYGVGMLISDSGDVFNEPAPIDIESNTITNVALGSIGIGFDSLTDAETRQNTVESGAAGMDKGFCIASSEDDESVVLATKRKFKDSFVGWDPEDPDRIVFDCTLP